MVFPAAHLAHQHRGWSVMRVESERRNGIHHLTSLTAARGVSDLGGEVQHVGNFDIDAVPVVKHPLDVYPRRGHDQRSSSRHMAWAES